MDDGDSLCSSADLSARGDDISFTRKMQSENCQIHSRVDELLATIDCSLSHDSVSDGVFEIVPHICTLLTDKSEAASPELVQAVRELLLLLPDLCSPKELILALLEQTENFADDVKFCALLQPIQLCLNRLTSQREHSLVSALDLLSAHLATLLLDAEPTDIIEVLPSAAFPDTVQTLRASTVVYKYLQFLEPFVQEISWREASGQLQRLRHMPQVWLITTNLLSVLEHPLACCDLRPTVDENKSNSAVKFWLCAEKCAALFSALHPDVIKALAAAEERNATIERRMKSSTAAQSGEGIENGDKERKLSVVGLGVIAYLTVGECVCTECIPNVYQHVYIFEICCPLAVDLLGRSESIWAIHKGVVLCSSLLQRIGIRSVDGNFMENKEVRKFIRSLAGVMTACKVKELAQMAMKAFESLLKVFDSKGRYAFLCYVLNELQHSGLIGYAIVLLKNEVDECLRNSTVVVDEHFIGPALESLLRLICILPNKEKTDLLAENDRIMSALNLIRYLLIRDKPIQNVTGIWNLISHIDKQYLQPTRAALSVSRGYFIAESQRLKNGESAVNQPNPDGCDFEFTVGGEKLPEMSHEERVEMVHVALIKLDMMDSVLGRIGELVDERRTL